MDLGRIAVAKNNRQHVEPARTLVGVFVVNVIPGHLGDLPLFGRRYPIGRIVVAGLASRPDLDKDDRFLVQGDQVEFTGRTTVVPGENAIPETFEEPSGGTLAG